MISNFAGGEFSGFVIIALGKTSKTTILLRVARIRKQQICNRGLVGTTK